MSADPVLRPPSSLRRFLRTTALLLVSLGGSAAGDPPDLDLPPGDPAVEALRRAQTRSGAILPGQAFPQSAPVLAAWLRGKALPPHDSLLVFGRHPFQDGELVRWSDSARDHAFRLSTIVEAAAAKGDTADGYALGGLGARIHGTLGHRLAFFTEARIYTEKSGRARFTHQFDPELGETYSVEKGLGDSLLDFRTYNRFEYYVKYSRNSWSLKAGHDRMHLGPGYFSSLTATRDTPPYYLMEGRIDFAPWLALDNYLVRMTDTDHDIRKFANLHRLEFKPTRYLALAYQDAVVYQDRDPDPAYFLPFVPLTFAEANAGGRDNAAMAFDALLATPWGGSLWGEIFMDDLLGPGSFFDDFWENRWAVLVGFQWALPPTIADADLVVEWSRAEPWTYNGRKPQTSFKHFNVPSASLLGPDSRTWDVQASWRPLRWMELRERLRLRDKGLGRPGTLGTIHDDAIDGQTKDFLGGPVRSERLLDQEVRLRYGRFAALRLLWTADLRGNGGDGFHASLRLER